MLTSVRSLMAASFLVGSALVATPALAQDDEAEVGNGLSVSGNVAIVSDYRFRGVSLSAGDIALQGGVDVVHDSGFYVGAWGSSIQGGTPFGELELDLYAGFSTALSEAVTLDVGLLYYMYPTTDDPLNLDPDTDYFEPYASLSTTLGPVGATVGVAYAWDQDALGNNDNLYLYTDFSLGIPNTPVTLSAHAGYTDGPLSVPFIAGTGNDGFDWSLGASANVIGGLSVGVAYVGVEGPSIDGFSDDTIVGTLSYTM